MGKYEHLYNNDPRFRAYVDKCKSDYDLTEAEMLRNKTIQLVGDYYADNPAREAPVTETTKVGGC